MVVLGQFEAQMRWRMQILGERRLKRCVVDREGRKMGLVGGYERVVLVGAGIGFEIVVEIVDMIIVGTVVVEKCSPKAQQ
jgi:hypothetical protein